MQGGGKRNSEINNDLDDLEDLAHKSNKALNNEIDDF